MSRRLENIVASILDSPLVIFIKIQITENQNYSLKIYVFAVSLEKNFVE